MKKPWLLLLSTWCASVALAEPPVATETQQKGASIVYEKLVDPLMRAQGKRSKFSRAAPPPSARRVRVLDAAPRVDGRGQQFVRFVVDERLPWDDEGEWSESSLRGCAYLNPSQVWVKRGDAHVPASSLLGKRGKLRQDVCRAATAASGTVASR